MSDLIWVGNLLLPRAVVWGTVAILVIATVATFTWIIHSEAEMNALDETCKKCGAKLRDHIIGGPAPYHPNPIKETDLERRIRRLRAAVNGDDFEFEINGGSPFDDVKALLAEYDRIRAITP